MLLMTSPRIIPFTSVLWIYLANFASGFLQQTPRCLSNVGRTRCVFMVASCSGRSRSGDLHSLDTSLGPHDDPTMNRRSALNWTCKTVTAAASASRGACLIVANPSAASAATTAPDESRTAKPLAPITHKVFMNVRISRSDGTFYVRDDLPDIQENTVFYSRLVLGLFGTVAPTAVQQFLSYVTPAVVNDDDDPLPTYARSSFKSLDQSTGLLVGGSIPGLVETTIGGGNALQYGGRILPASLWIDKDTQPLSHSQKGLLSHKSLDVTPTFGITTRPSAAELDGSHFVFGQVLLDEESNEFLQRCQGLPTYSMERPMGDPRQEETTKAVEDVATALFNSQRSFFRGAATALGDSRASKVYEGKLLRRVEVTQVGLL